jgi:hypothetical protein
LVHEARSTKHEARSTKIEYGSLIETVNRAIPGLWLSFAAGCGLIAAMVARPQTSDVLDYALDVTASTRPTVPAQF